MNQKRWIGGILIGIGVLVILGNVGVLGLLSPEELKLRGLALTRQVKKYHYPKNNEVSFYT